MKRFYREVTLGPGDDGIAVLLDGRPLRTPAKHPLLLPSEPLAAALAAEWREQGESVDPSTMPVTRLATTARDHLPAQRDALIEALAGYGQTDLLCYRAAQPADLAARQAAAWQPPLDWAAKTLAARLAVTTAMLPIAQPADALQALRRAIEQLEDWPLMGVHAAAGALGSVVLALALWHEAIAAAPAVEASLLDELYEIERWGLEQEAARRHRLLHRDVAAAAVFLQGLRAA